MVLKGARVLPGVEPPKRMVIMTALSLPTDVEPPEQSQRRQKKGNALIGRVVRFYNSGYGAQPRDEERWSEPLCRRVAYQPLSDDSTSRFTLRSDFWL